ncbi:MAG: hypothetical protein ACJAZO_003986 [Myxococcota bacterium]|jgi:hypothetical protein
MEYGFEKASLDGHKGKRRDSSRANVDPLASGGLGDGLSGSGDVDPLIASAGMVASAATGSAPPEPEAKEPAAEAVTLDMSQPPGTLVKEPADDDNDDSADSNPAENSEAEGGESADPTDENPDASDANSNADSPGSSDKKDDKKGGNPASQAAPSAVSDATIAIDGGKGGAGSAVSTTDPTLAPAIGNPTDLKPNKAEASGGNADPGAEAVSTDTPELESIDTDTPAFTVDDVNMPELDTSNYKTKRKAAKAVERYAQVQQAVDQKLAKLIADAHATVEQLTNNIHAERDAHIGGLDASRNILKENIQSARDALFAERDSASGRVTLAIEAQRGAIKTQSTTSQKQIRSAASALKRSIRRACDGALNEFGVGYEGSKKDITDGIVNYKTNVAERLTEAQKTLKGSGGDNIDICVRYRLVESLGEKFAATGDLLNAIDALRLDADKTASDFFVEGQGIINGVATTAESSANIAKSAGTSSIRSQERSSLAALDITHSRIEGQLKTATEDGAARLDNTEETRNLAIDAAQGQAHADAEHIRRTATGAVWGSARTEAQRLVAATGSEAVDLAFKPKKKTVDASLAAAQGVQLDISPACDGATKSVAIWSQGHTTTRGELDGSGAQGTQDWRDEAVGYVTSAEVRATESVTSTGSNSISALNDLGQHHADNLGKNGTDAKGTLTRTVTSQTANLRSIGTSFINGLDATLGTTDLENLDDLISVGRDKLYIDFGKRADDLYTAMDGLTTDETAVFTALRGIGAYGAAALVDIYGTFKKHGSLYADLNGDLNAEEYKIAEMYLNDNDGGGAQLELAYYQDGLFGEDEAAITTLLKNLTGDQLTDLKDQDGWATTEKHLYANIADDDLDSRVIKSLVAGNKMRAEALELIDKITDARWNEDPQALRTLIAGIPEGDRIAILTEFAVLQELAGREGGLDAVDFKQEELDPELAKQMGASAEGEDGNAIMVTGDDLQTREVTEAEKRFGDWVSQDNLKDDDLYKEGGAGVGNQVKKAFTSETAMGTIAVAGPMGIIPGLAGGLIQNANDDSDQRVLDKEESDLLKNQAMYGTSSLQGKAADVRYETQEGHDVEKAYDAMVHDHKDPVTGESTNTAFKTEEERELAHKEWKEAFEAVYQEQYKTSVSSDIDGANISDEEKKILEETQQGGQASAETMLDYAENGNTLGIGTNEWAATKAFTNGSATDIKAYFDAHPGASESLLSEFSGDELHNMKILMVGKVETDSQRWDIAKLRNQYTRGEGSGNLLTPVAYAMGVPLDAVPEEFRPKISANLFWDCVTGSGEIMDFNYNTMKSMIDARGGEATAFGDDGNLINLQGQSDEQAKEDLRLFRGHESSLEAAEKAFHSTMDIYTELIATVVGLIVSVLLSIVTAGAASPMVLALAGGLATIGTKAALMGDRYGWEEMAMDSALLALEVATAGLASKMTEAVKADKLLKLQLAGKAGNLTEGTIKISKLSQLGLKTAETAFGSTGKVLLDETTYEKSFQEGLTKGFKKVGLDITTVWMDAGIDGIGDTVFEKSIKNAKSEFTKDAFTIGQVAITDYGKGQGATLLGDVVNGTSEFGDKQSKLGTAAAFSALKKSMSVRSERDSKGASKVADDVNADPGADGFSQKAWQDKADDANRKTDIRKGIAGLTTTIAKTAVENN